MPLVMPLVMPPIWTKSRMPDEGPVDQPGFDRRDFLRRGLRKTAEAAGQVAGARLSSKPASWIRPPYALAEDDFLSKCDRCGKCAEACQFNVIFKLPDRLGDRVAGTPALDLVNRGCHMCQDWPCVAACEPGALSIPITDDEGEAEPAPSELPVLARASIDTALCLPYLGPECGACASACPVPDALIWKDRIKPVITRDCTGCGMCREVCVVEPKAVSISPPAG